MPVMLNQVCEYCRLRGMHRHCQLALEYMEIFLEPAVADAKVAFPAAILYSENNYTPTLLSR